MIESRYWKSDLLRYAKELSPKKKPPYWTIKRQVNTEKDIILAFFMVRKLAESNKFSPVTNNHKLKMFRYRSIISIDNWNYWDIREAYDLANEEEITKKHKFVSNQLIHGGATFAHISEDRNCEYIYTCSEFERQKYIYRIPISEIVRFLKIAGKDYPKNVSWKYNPKIDDYDITTE